MDKFLDILRDIGLTSDEILFLILIGFVSNIILIVIGFFGQQAILFFFNGRLNRSLETHRSELSLIVAKNSKIYDRQLQTIAELYKYIARMQIAFKAMTNQWKQIKTDVDKEEEQRIQKAWNAYNDFYFFYIENKIFFSEDINNLLDKLSNKFWESRDDYTFGQRTGINDYNIVKEYLNKANDTVVKEIPAVLIEIEEKFRKLMSIK